MASGNLLCRFGAAAGQSPISAYATPDIRNGLMVLDFDDAIIEYIIFVDVMPPNYSGGGLTVKILWMATTATSGQVLWAIDMDRMQRGVSDQDVDSYSTGVFAGGATTPAVAPSGTEIESIGILAAPTNTDGVLVGERFRLRLARVATDSIDTLVGDAEIVLVNIYET